MCDQISDAILDGLLAQDPNSRVAVETLVTTGLAHVDDQTKQGCFIVDYPLRVQAGSLSVDHDAVVMGFAGINTGPELLQNSLQSSRLAQ